MLTVGSSLQTAARIKEAGPFGPASVAYWVFSELSLAAHALLGDEQDASGDNEDATDDIEDRGTNATGAGKDSAGVASDGDRSRPRSLFSFGLSCRQKADVRRIIQEPG